MGKGGGGGWIMDIGHHKHAIYVGLLLKILSMKVIVEFIDQYHK